MPPTPSGSTHRTVRRSPTRVGPGLLSGLISLCLCLTQPRYAQANPQAANWAVDLGLTQSLGIGAFVQDRFARTVSYGYALFAKGSYQFHPSFWAWLRLDADQQLTTTHSDLGTIPREFYFRDIQLGVSSPDFFRETKYTDISFSASADIRLPTSKQARAIDRVLQARVALTLSRSFTGIGPGTLTLSLTESFRKDLGAANITRPDFSTCNAQSQSGQECLLAAAPINFGFTHAVNLSYRFLENFDFSIGLTLTNNFHNRTSNSDVAILNAEPLGGPAVELTSAPQASTPADQRDSIQGILELAYTWAPHWSFAAGLSTQSNPFIQSGDNPSQLRFPFFDFQSTANNLTTMYFSATYSF